MPRAPGAGFWVFLLAAVSACWSPVPARADTFYPMVMAISPTAVQAGTTTECVLEGRYNFGGAYKVLVTGTGVEGTIDGSEPAKGKKRRGKRAQAGSVKVRFKVAADALLGIRDVRVATPRGASTLGQIVVVRDPIVLEAPNNDTMKTAQLIKLPATVCGAIEKNEDVDFYKFHVEAGTALTFHVYCQRLENRIHDLQATADPILTIRDGSGTVLAENDNYYSADPLLHHRFATAGDYFLEIRDVRYSGDRYWTYCIEIHDRPFVTNVFPSRVTPGKPTRLRLVGFNLPASPFADLTLPRDAPDGLQWAMLALPNKQITNAVPIIVSRLPEVTEIAVDHSTPARAQKIATPAGICGCIARPGEVDCYAFDAKAGEHVSFTVVASDHQSRLDSVLRILNDKGQPLTENDDYTDLRGHSDSRIEDWVVPANGRYIIEIRDLHSRGGPEYVYFIQVRPSAPYFTLTLDTDKTPLAPGVAGVIFARVYRHEGFTGPVQLAIAGLPKGVTASCGRILETGTDGCIIVRAAGDAPVEVANVRVTGTATVTQKDKTSLTLTATARPLQEYYSPGGGRGNYPVETHAVSVGDGLDLKGVKLGVNAVSLKPGESKKVEVSIERSPGFNENVTLAAFYQHLGSIYGNSLPAGVTVDEKASQTLLTGTQVKGSIVLKAAADAKPAQNQQVSIMAHVSINFAIKFTYSSEPLLVTVEKPSK